MKTEELKTLYIKMYEYMIAKDIKALDKMHSDDFVLIHMTGVHQNKKEYLQAIKDGTLNYYSYQDVEIIPKTDTTFIGRCKVLAAVYGGSKHTWKLQLKFQLAKKDGEWYFTLASASTY